MDCIFCSIIKGDIPSTKVYEDDTILAFKDIAPMARVHIVVIPKEHICCADKITEENSHLVAHIFEKIPQIAKSAGITNGYRIVNNCGPDADQSVQHLHFHILGGEKLSAKLC